jgi:protein O-mannosyl-transferase
MTKKKKEIKQKNSVEYYILLALLFAIPFLLYGYSITFTEYVLDDKIVLSENKFVKVGLSGIIDILSNETFTGYFGEQKILVEGARYRPLSLVTFAIEYEFLGLNPQVSHLINVLLYALTGIILFRIFLLFFPAENNSPLVRSIPFIMSLLFLLHPIHTEVVANIKSRDEILCLLFSVCSLYFSYRLIISGKKYFAFLSTIVFLFALMAKENAITFITVIPMTFYFFSNLPKNKIVWSTAPLLISVVFYFILRNNALGFLFDSGKEANLLMNNPFLGTSTDEKFATIFYTLFLYLKLLFVPYPLTHDYYPYQIPILQWSNPKAFFSLFLFIGLLIFAIKNFSKKTVYSFCILFFIATISIVSNTVFPVGVFMAERFLYMPSVAFCLFIAFFISKQLPTYLKNIQLLQKIQIAMLLILTTGYSLITIARVPDWKNTMTLNKSGAAVSKNSARAQQFYGYALYTEATKETDRKKKLQLYNEANPYIDRALLIYPSYSDALTTKAGLLAGYYQLDNDLDKLLNGFYKIQLIKPIPFVDQYLSYIDNRADRSKLNNFYTRLGKSLIQKGNNSKGNYYLSKVR